MIQKADYKLTLYSLKWPKKIGIHFYSSVQLHCQMMIWLCALCHDHVSGCKQHHISGGEELVSNSITIGTIKLTHTNHNIDC